MKIYQSKFQALLTVNREPKLKRENQQDATNSLFIIKLSFSTCFGHHYAHHQENKTVCYCMRCSAWVCRLWFAVVMWSCVVSCVHCVTVTFQVTLELRSELCALCDSYCSSNFGAA